MVCVDDDFRGFAEAFGNVREEFAGVFGDAVLVERDDLIRVRQQLFGVRFDDVRNECDHVFLLHALQVEDLVLNLLKDERERFGVLNVVSDE